MAKNVIAFKIQDGTEFFQELKKIVNEQQSSHFEITAVSGKLKDFELAQSGKQNQMQKYFKDPHKIINAHGTIEKTGNDVQINLVLSMTKDGFSSSGGRLLNGRTFGNVDVLLKIVEEGKFVKSW